MLQSRTSMIILAVAVGLGLFFGNALNGLLGALILAAITGAAAWFTLSRAEAAPPTGDTLVHVQDPPIARFLFQDVRAAALWLPLRLFVGWEWLDGGWQKFQDPKWMSSSEAIRGYWERAVAIPAQGRPAITYDWWRDFLQAMLDNKADVWFSKVIVFGELAVGLGLLLGALVGVAAVGGLLLNMSFLLSGSTSTNPILLLAAIGLILAWKVAGWVGLDRVLLPMLGTPWQPGALRPRPPPAVTVRR